MELSLILEYGWVLIILVGLEGLLAADNALVMAIMVKHLPDEKRKKALFYGLAGAFVFRFTSLFVISYLVDIWQIQAIGAAYLLFICINNLYKKHIAKKEEEHEEDTKESKGSGFWMTVLKVEIADIAFAVDSILAAVALAVTLPPTGLGYIGGLDAGQFIVIFTGGFIGLVIIRFAARVFVDLLHRRPGLETAAFLIVGWVGVKLAIITFCHQNVGLLPADFAHSGLWKITFWVVLLGIAIGGWFLSSEKEKSPAIESVGK